MEMSGTSVTPPAPVGSYETCPNRPGVMAMLPPALCHLSLAGHARRAVLIEPKNDLRDGRPSIGGRNRDERRVARHYAPEGPRPVVAWVRAVFVEMAVRRGLHARPGG